VNARLARLDAAANRASLFQLGRQFALYFVVSAGALVLDFGLFLALTRFGGMDYLPASAISFSTGTLASYLLSVRLVFDHREVRDRRMEFASFFAIGLIGLAVNQLALLAAVSGLGLAAPVAKVAAAGFSFVANFLARRTLLFSARAKA
jgi:putative flippase GtrA